MDLIQPLLAFLVTIGVLVTVHEAGHFLAARLMGVHVVRFSVGFGRPLLRWTDRNGTEWVVAAIPLGGYVRMYDERDDEATRLLEGAAPDAARLPDPARWAHNRKSPWARIFIAAAGPFANFALAVVVFWVLYQVGVTGLVPFVDQPRPDSPAARAGFPSGVEIVAVDGEGVDTWREAQMVLLDRLGSTGSIAFTVRGEAAGERTVEIPVERWLAEARDPDPLDALGFDPVLPALVETVVPGSPADAAGLRLGDRIVAVDGAPIPEWSAFVEAVRSAPGETLRVELVRDGRPRTVDLVPGRRQGADGEAHGFAGVTAPVRTTRYGPLQAVPAAFAETGARTAQLVGMLGKMVVGLVSYENLSGPVSIARVAGASAEVGPSYYLTVLGALSVSLGLLNLLPIPVLDGGHILFYGIEVMRGSPLPERVQALGIQLGLLLVGGIMLLALYNDFMRL